MGGGTEERGRGPGDRLEAGDSQIAPARGPQISVSLYLSQARALKGQTQSCRGHLEIIQEERRDINTGSVSLEFFCFISCWLGCRSVSRSSRNEGDAGWDRSQRGAGGLSTRKITHILLSEGQDSHKLRGRTDC